MEDKKFYDITIIEISYECLTEKHEFKNYCIFKEIERENLLLYIDIIKELISKNRDSYKYSIMID